MKKDKGAVDGIFYSIATTMIVVILIYAMIPLFATINARQEINAVARPYLLKMESTGFMTTEDSVLLKQDISKRVSGTVKVEILPETNLTEAEDAAYGEKVTLAFEVTFESYVVSIPSIFSPNAAKQSLTIAYNEASIAKGG